MIKPGIYTPVALRRGEIEKAERTILSMRKAWRFDHASETVRSPLVLIFGSDEEAQQFLQATGTG